MRRLLTVSVLMAALCGMPLPLTATQATDDALRQAFLAPPDSAKPRVWWHWMDGNVTLEGVHADFDWMKRVGIGGVQNFEALINTPKIVPQRLTFLTPEWRNVLLQTVTLADRLGLEFAIAGSPGFSETGGPWVKPEQAMKKLVWSETPVEGGKRFRGMLPQPPAVAGPFGNIPADGAAMPGASGFYRDQAVVAYRAADGEAMLNGDRPRVTSSAGAIDAALLADGDLVRAIRLPYGAQGEPGWIQFEFAAPRTARALSFVARRPRIIGAFYNDGPPGRIEASEDGVTFRRLAELPLRGAEQLTVAFPAATARIFRIVFEPDRKDGFNEEIRLSPVVALLRPPPPPVNFCDIAELVLQGGARIDRFEDKAGFSTQAGIDHTAPVAVDRKAAIPRAEIVDLTHRMQPNGLLEWSPPAGRWVVLRLGYSLTGRLNHPATPEGTGLEVDKLNRGHVKAYLDAYLGEYEAALGRDLIGRRGLQYLMVDSWEAGTQNWTEDMLEKFAQRRGYDLRPWLPALAGRVVESAEASERFLWDWRKTLGELLADEHYGQIDESLRARNMGRYGEAHEKGRAFIGDGMQVKKSAAVPMSAMWSTPHPLAPSPNVWDADVRESASVAHIYGQNLVAAESLTAFSLPYGDAPEMLKPTADRMLANGLNRFVIHTSTHQPSDTPGPGIGLGPFGQYFTRKETWGEQAGAWMRYLARSSHLLQQGRFVADIAYLYGEDGNITALFGQEPAPIPAGYNFDFINADALLNELSVKQGRLVTRTGMSYRVLALDASTQRLSVPVLRKIRDLVRAGAVVVGARPLATPSLADDDDEFRAIVSELWGAPGAQTPGEGKVFADRPLVESLQALQIAPDVVFEASAETRMRFVHRALDDGDLYFVSNAMAQPRTVEASFRVSGKAPELWRADTGTIEPVSYRIENGRTVVPLDLQANDAVFVVFRRVARTQSMLVPRPVTEVLMTLQGPWDVSFPKDLGAPAHARFDMLHSWTEDLDAGVKYFSGTAIYEKTIRVPRTWLKPRNRLRIDLGDVKNVAEVLVNGRSAGVLWKKPFSIDITDAVRPGSNRIELKVTNLWPNRLIGDKQPGARRIAFAAFDPFKPDSPLLPSGLLGPVTLVRLSE